MNTFAQTKNGQWVVTGPACDIVAGREVDVVMRSGKRVKVYIENIGVEFRDGNGIICCYGYFRECVGVRPKGYRQPTAHDNNVAWSSETPTFSVVHKDPSDVGSPSDRRQRGRGRTF